MTTPAGRPLNAEVQIPYLGFGTYLIRQDEAAAAVQQALAAGYRHIDTAEIYRNEAGVGAGIAHSGVARSDLFVTTKLWPGGGKTPKTAAETLAAMDLSLGKLQLDYVDLYLIHAPFNRDQRLSQWQALVELKARGKARAIGVSNFSQAHIEELRAAGLPLPDANQIEIHPWSQKTDLVAYLEANAIVPIAYSSLVPLSTWRAAEGQQSAKTAGMKAEGEKSDAPFKVMARKYGVSEAQVLLRWAVQKGYPVLPKSTRPDRIRQNADLFSFVLDDGDMTAIAAMDRGDGLAWPGGDPVRWA